MDDVVCRGARMSSMARYGAVWCGMVRYGPVWCDVAWQDAPPLQPPLHSASRRLKGTEPPAMMHSRRSGGYYGGVRRGLCPGTMRTWRASLDVATRAAPRRSAR